MDQTLDCRTTGANLGQRKTAERNDGNKGKRIKKTYSCRLKCKKECTRMEEYQDGNPSKGLGRKPVKNE